ncbi:MAG: hypothetical protein M3Y75_05470 [Actinomycetota bacterium]|nr:hypothetical protein [Actinomycetota bacterium]
MSFELPSGFHVGERAGDVLYPVQIAAVANWDTEITMPTFEETAKETSWPQLRRMPEGGQMVWMLLGDVAYDNKLGEWEGGGPLGSSVRFDYLAPDGATPADAPVRSDVRPLGLGDETASRWPNVAMWKRTICLANADGKAEEEPLYLKLFIFSALGIDSAPLAQIVGSLRARYV